MSNKRRGDSESSRGPARKKRKTEENGKLSLITLSINTILNELIDLGSEALSLSSCGKPISLVETFATIVAVETSNETEYRSWKLQVRDNSKAGRNLVVIFRGPSIIPADIDFRAGKTLRFIGQIDAQTRSLMCMYYIPITSSAEFANARTLAAVTQKYLSCGKK
eukprot:TRINITY_DN3420_c0_g1_i1.p2 TRINITY_DN3420_c0_g1~~TRINITY_DN3420_c0_g1_i1.p2  ORF type:complete len:165 (+),score=16.91 TRINITY_DN3420_c0_g1_i1:168-662(+)